MKRNKVDGSGGINPLLFQELRNEAAIVALAKVLLTNFKFEEFESEFDTQLAHTVKVFKEANPGVIDEK